MKSGRKRVEISDVEVEFVQEPEMYYKQEPAMVLQTSVRLRLATLVL